MNCNCEMLQTLCTLLCKPLPLLLKSSKTTWWWCKWKEEFSLEQVHGGPQDEYSYSSTLCLTSTLDGDRWSTSRHGRFTPGKETQYPFYKGLSGPQGGSGQVRKIPPPSGFDPTTVNPVASLYTDWVSRPRWWCKKAPKYVAKPQQITTCVGLKICMFICSLQLCHIHI
jgi:hypothetical protein